jgi:small nuclear ribonucleoprotein (snRNP)-like protein
MNIVLGDAVEEVTGGEGNIIGMVVIRGNSIVQVSLLKDLAYMMPVF